MPDHDRLGGSKRIGGICHEQIQTDTSIGDIAQEAGLAIYRILIGSFSPLRT